MVKQIVDGHEPTPFIRIDFIGLILTPFFWLYDKLTWRFFKPEPMRLYAMMIEQIDRENEFMELMRKKGFHFKRFEVL